VRARALVHLASLNLRSDRRGALVNAGAACVGAAALVFFVALGLGVGQAARRMFASDARLLEVVPAAVSLGGALGGGLLDDSAASPGPTGGSRSGCRWPRAAPRRA